MQNLIVNKSVFAEPDAQRLAHRLAAVAGQDLAPQELDRLVAGDIDLMKQLSTPAMRAVAALVRPGSEARGELESIIGPTIDYVSVAFLDQARAASRAVVRIVDVHRQPIGTGVMISPSLVMTNHHVAGSPEEASGLIAQFDYELTAEEDPIPITEFRLDPATWWFTSPVMDLDVSIISIGSRVTGTGDLRAFGFNPLSSSDGKHAVLDFVTVIEHPAGDFKQIALRENRVLGRGQSGRTLFYSADTKPGSSGSPAFNDEFQLVALHHAGGPKIDAKMEDGTAAPVPSNEGIRISAIVKRLSADAETRTGAERDLILGALNPPFSGPSLLVGRGTPPAVSPPEAITGAGPASGAVGTADGGTSAIIPAAALGGDGWVRLTVPVELSVRVREGGSLGTGGVAIDLGPGTAATVGSGANGATVDANGQVESNSPPDPAYSKRRGYDDDFIGTVVPMPTLSAAQQDDVASPAGNAAHDPVLRYLHFSTVQNAVRLMPFFTAVNIDGGRARSIDRKTGEVEATDRWFVDPRVAPNELDQSFYGAQRPHIFDRGHMVRRIDPAWGSKSVAKRAADDTFHFTNACPQVAIFNQSGKLWAGIEDYVLDTAKATDDRVSVFSGPVFSQDDPPYLGVHIPKAFWKIVSRMDHGKLRATGFLASQADLLQQLIGGPEAFTTWADLGQVQVFQTSIADIATATGLGFGALVAADTFKKPAGGPAAGGPAGAPERLESLSRPLASLDDVSW